MAETSITDFPDLPKDPKTGVSVITIGKKPASKVPDIGAVEDGYRFKGGDPADKTSWQKTPAVGEIEDQFRFKGGDPSNKENWEPLPKWPSGIKGSALAQAQGQLHGWTDAFGSPVDVVASGMRELGVPIGEEPIGGSKNLRRLVSLPGQAVGWLMDEIGGQGTAENWGLGGHATYEDINEVPETYRPQARMGEVVGQTVGAATGLGDIAVAGSAARGLPVTERLAAASKPTGSAAKNIWRQTMAESIKPSSMRNALVSGLGAGAGGYGAEAAFPGSPTAQMVAQTAGGLGPAALGVGAERGVAAAKKPLDPFLTSTPEGAKTVIARSLGKEFEKAGESPETAIRGLRAAPVIPGASPAERSGSRVLMGVEETLRKSNPDLANILDQRNAQFGENIKTSINTAFGAGERQALTKAAEGIKDQLDRYIAGAEELARNAAMGLDPQIGRDVANIQARSILESALKEARKAESELWGQVPRDTDITASKTVKAFNNVKSEMLPEQGLPSLLERVLTRLKEEPGTKLGELQNLRSEILNQARIARAGSDFNLARRLEAVGSAALDDMNTAGGDAAKLARAFSRELNDRFSRSFAGDVLGLKSTGAKEVRPSLTLETAVSGKPQTIAEKLKELQLAATPIPKQLDSKGNIIKPDDLSPEMKEVQEQFLQSLSSRIVDANTGRVSVAKGASFLRDYAPVVDQFPLYKQKIENAITAQLGSERIAGLVQDYERSAYAKVLEAGEVPMRAVAKTLASPTPARDFTELARLARNGGADAVGGLRASILDFVMDGSVHRGNLSYALARSKLVNALYANGPSLLELMKSNGIVSEQQARAITERLDAAVSHEMASKQALRIDEVGDEAGKMARWGSRILGAKLASKLGFTHGGAGVSLQVAQIAASAAEQAMTRLPLDRARRVLTDALAADDPKELIDILERISVGEGTKKSSTNIRYMLPLLRLMLPQSKTKSDWATPEDIFK